MDMTNATGAQVQLQGGSEMQTIYPLWFYRWVPGVSMRIGAIVENGKTLYGPVLPFRWL